MKFYSSLLKMTHPIEQGLRELSKKYDVPYEELVSRFRKIDQRNRHRSYGSNRKRQQKSLSFLRYELKVKKENQDYEEF